MPSFETEITGEVATLKEKVTTMESGIVKINTKLDTITANTAKSKTWWANINGFLGTISSIAVLFAILYGGVFSSPSARAAIIKLLP